MKRAAPGHLVIQRTQGETVQAFVPAPLPPDPPIQWSAHLLAAQQRAALALGRLDGVTGLLPDPTLFLYSYVRKEAVLSSQIEGTQSSLSDLMAYENGQAPGAPLDDVVEVSRYVAAMKHGLERLQSGFPICLRLVRDIHQVLLSTGRGSGKQLGEFRTSQNWIGGSRPGNATFVPPPQEALADCLGSWERFLQADVVPMDPLSRAALAHVQFETMHPFLDGNGRVGRLMVTLLLSAHGVLREPMLYLSLYLKRHRSTYYDLLQKVRTEGDWEAWLDFFFQGITETAENAVATAQSLLALFAEDRMRIQTAGRITGSALQVHHHLQGRPVSSAAAIAQAQRLTPATVNRAMEQLQQIGIVRELTGGRRNRLFAYSKALELLTAGT